MLLNMDEMDTYDGKKPTMRLPLNSSMSLRSGVLRVYPFLKPRQSFSIMEPAVTIVSAAITT